MPNLGIDKRSEVLQYALIIESFTSIFLGELLGIKDVKNSRVLGNKSSPISFNQKITLLIEIEALESVEKTKFVTFMEVRNQFMHNLEASSYETCFSYLEGKDKYLVKAYPQKEGISKEEQLELAFKALSEDVVKSTIGLLDKVKEKIADNVERDVHKEFMGYATDAIREIENAFNSIYEKAAKNQKQTIKIAELKEIGTTIRKIFYKIVTRKMIKIDPNAEVDVARGEASKKHRDSSAG
ncbi:hypothetical protein EZ428_18675 [Pedobacter frigiditerrae]|uniref:Uncharacterized protein n=1 Tax=Pedobacter frigiditerrae TaxID=2530452 RepID=A0A4R0MPT7_9SPHI|nr:hypothetical protein [Pedobacter frigiditerrae]TCC88663.1 hypothetical protein EZ428_18675 [Pedobacter frigiditerrae]